MRPGTSTRQEEKARGVSPHSDTQLPGQGRSLGRVGPFFSRPGSPGHPGPDPGPSSGPGDVESNYSRDSWRRPEAEGGWKEKRERGVKPDKFKGEHPKTTHFLMEFGRYL